MSNKKKGVRKSSKNSKIDIVENDSLQYNRQDLDQEQQVNVNPVQLNNHNINVHLVLDKEMFNSKITGTTYLDIDKEIINNVKIDLYFGFDYGRPVYKTTSDVNGNYTIEEIPPGYYIIHANYYGKYKYKSQHIKVLPGQHIEHLIFLN